MKPEQKSLIDYRRYRSEDCLKEAELLIQHNHFNAAVNRLYYACFYIVSALLLSEDMYSAKHSGIISLFNRHWVRHQRVDKSLGRFYKEIFSYRQKGDYDDLVYFEREQAELLYQEATAFVNILKSKLP
ncbi:MAG: HEPN domain-containing protein [Firmicutes bacterium]|nr:HEPN domain-containing protein [Bacillota bacterium]